MLQPMHRDSSIKPPDQPSGEQRPAGHAQSPERSGGEQKVKKGFLRFPRSWAEVKKLGWKFILGFILFYLIRDTILYILIPYLIYKGIISL